MSLLLPWPPPQHQLLLCVQVADVSRMTLRLVSLKSYTTVICFTQQVFHQRLLDEFNMPVLLTTPNVPYTFVDSHTGAQQVVVNLGEWHSASTDSSGSSKRMVNKHFVFLTTPVCLDAFTASICGTATSAVAVLLAELSLHVQLFVVVYLLNSAYHQSIHSCLLHKLKSMPNCNTAVMRLLTDVSCASDFCCCDVYACSEC
jgi:hypothetical protein